MMNRRKREMKKGFWGVVLVVAMALILSPASATALRLDYSNLDGASISFSGATDSFTFNDNALGKDFSITGGVGLTGATVGLQGHIGGTFTLGVITTSGLLQTAGVTGPGIFEIYDGSNTFHADLVWVDIYTLGGSGGVNSGLAANLANVSYSGSNTDLLQFLNGGVTNITFQFQPAKSLTELTAEESNSTSYSGSLSPVPEPAAMLLLGGSLIVLWGSRKRIKK
jgi:hypothetical protein